MGCKEVARCLLHRIIPGELADQGKALNSPRCGSIAKDVSLSKEAGAETAVMQL